MSSRRSSPPGLRLREMIARAVLPAVLLISLLVLTLEISLVFFAHPLSDDFCRADAVRRWGVLGAGAYEYLFFAGRWSSALVQHLTWRVLHPLTQYRYPLLVVFSVLAASYYTLFRYLYGGKWRPAASSAAVLMALAWSGFRSPGQSAYHYVMVVENQVPIALAMLVLIGWLSARRTTLRTALLFAATVVLPGMHELYGAMLVATAGALTAWLARRGDPRVGRLLLASLAAALGLGIVLVAPGNATRIGAGPDLSAALPHFLVQLVNTPVRWILNPRALGALLLAALVATRYLPAAWRDFRLQRTLAFLGLGALLLLMGAFVPTYFLGKAPSYRTQDAVGLVLYLCVLLAVLAFFSTDERASSAESSRLAHCAALVLGLSLIFTGNTLPAVKDLFARSPEYHRMKQARYALLRAAVTERRSVRVQLPVIPAWPHTQSYTAERSDWTHRCYRSFFGVAEIEFESSEAAAGP